MIAAEREPIAIVGMAFRFPGGSSSPSKLWDLLKAPRDVLKSFPSDRLNLSRFHDVDGLMHGSTNVTNASYILDEDPKAFDANLFSISPLEAESMDPQQRMLLEVVYEAMEAGGCSLDLMSGSLTSVHVGVMNADYTDIQNRDTETISKYNATGTARSVLSNRISYVFDFRGPSITTDTACSSSLVALHQAVQCLHLGDCDSAIVGGVNLILDPAMYITESKLSMLSPESRSRMWDQAANGYARGEGVAALVLKPLSKAIKDGDSIEAIVRGTGVNSDGRSPGITMPTAVAQTALIRQTYEKAGLDPILDRCQFFECHGTGTKAGDPVEAQAVSDALIPPQDMHQTTPLYVGSIKTIIGHTEGCAGLAGVIKAVLAIKHQTIPPNLMFKDLDTAVRPVYGPMKIPTTAVPWPELTPGQPKRASVNSFGFGGTNAHAIIDEYLPIREVTRRSSHITGPLVISAHSGAALLSKVRSLHQYLEDNPSINLSDLSWTLQTRRTTHKIKTHFSESTREMLLNSMLEFTAQSSKLAPTDIGFQPQLIDRSEIPGVLGVFTGQGAQWATMGRGLLSGISLFREVFDRCEAVLTALPDGPTWSLRKELEAEGTTSRVSEAAISQPICTAVQIALVDVLKRAGLHFDAVVGHSSGEIAAAYTAGILSLSGSMQIAYYRGKYAHLASGTDGQAGGMIATGLPYDEAVALCDGDEFSGRLTVAASNSPTSVTLSGDVDAIADVKKYLETRDIFARALRVDTAYHSHHMKKCASAYLRSLLQCNIEVSKPHPDCIWSSSVRGDTKLLRGDLSLLKGQYWVQNMEQTVLFNQAIESAIVNGGPFDIAVEIGPHPALKSPAEETFKSSFGTAPLYIGTLKRSSPDVDALAATLGNYWSVMGSASVDFAGYRQACLGDKYESPKTVTDLPAYPFDRTQTFWRESRISENYRLGQDEPRELLGRRMPDDSTIASRWRNILTLDELPWLAGHEILGEVLMPGAGYISIALEAAKQLAGGRPTSLLEIQDVSILHPVVVPGQQERVETIFTARRLSSRDDETIEAEFDYCYWPATFNAAAVLVCTGKILVHLGQPAPEHLPPRSAMLGDLLDVPVSQAYSSLQSIGLNYQGIFKGMTQIRRRTNTAQIHAQWSATDLGGKYIVHPALLDVVFQSNFVAKAYPAQGLMDAAFLPVSISRVSVNPCVCPTGGDRDVAVDVDSYVTHTDASSMSGDMHVYTGGENPFIEIEGLVLKIAAEPLESDDVQIFCETVWKPDTSLVLPDPERDEDHDLEQMALAETIDRVAFFYLRQVLNETENTDISKCQEHHQRMLESFRLILRQVKSGQHRLLKPEWLQDDVETLRTLCLAFPNQIDLELIHAIGANLASVVTDETSLLEVMLANDMLSRLYIEGCGFVTINQEIGNLLQQITHKFPRANILEVGAGTGGTTQGILQSIGPAYQSYTFTDISAGFFEAAKLRLHADEKRITFRALDIEKPVSPQGFEEESYDIIIAVNVLHATRDLTATLQHVRSLLKPGGYLILGEITNTDVLRYSFIMGGLPGWWLGGDDSRRFHPCIPAVQWDQLLLDTGFSGLDLAFSDLEDENKHCNSLLVSRSLSPSYERLRDPIPTLETIDVDTPLLLIGGSTLQVAKIRTEIRRLLPSNWLEQTQSIDSIDDLVDTQIKAGTGVIFLQELDCPMFSKPVTSHQWISLQSLLANASRVLWIIKNHRSGSPESGMFLGIARSLEQEMPHLKTQVLDFETKESPASLARTAVEAFARLALHQPANVLWTVEPEVVMANGAALVPRIMPIKSMNDRYNSTKRELVRSDMPIADTIELRFTKRGLALVEVQQSRTPVTDDHAQMIVMYSLSIPSTEESLYLSLGRVADSDVHFLALSSRNRSHLRKPHNELVQMPAVECTPAALLAFRSCLIAITLSAVVRSTSITLVHNADRPLALAISRKMGSQVIFSTSNTDVPPEWLYVHPRASARAIKQILPPNVGDVLDCSEPSSRASNLVTVLSAARQWLPNGDLVREGTSTLGIAEALGQALNLMSHFSSGDNVSELVPCEVEIQNVAKLTGSEPSRSQIMDWTMVDSTASLTILPLQAKNLFRPDRTYLMVGLTGALGVSLCNWAVDNGARNLVITSRTPKVDSEWLAACRKRGAALHVWPMDVADETSVRATIARISKELPPLAGVCNGAMTLADKLFVDMRHDELNMVLEPKFKGSQTLDKVLGSYPLDFFILLSSCAMLIGNPGQSNYHAANLYMAGLAARRRSRGLNASVIHLGYIADVGYVTRQDHRMRERLEKLLFRPLSEADIHNAFAEAMHAGHTDSVVFDFAMGMGPAKEHVAHEVQPYYFHNPRFSHFNPPPGSSKRDAVQISNSLGSLVREATSEQDAIHCVQTAFCAKVEAILQLAVGSIQPQQSLMDAGIDSLVAVEIRNWFMKELGVKIPVVKILGGSSVEELCNNAAKKMLSMLLETTDQVPQPIQADEQAAPKSVAADESTELGTLDLNGDISASETDYTPESGSEVDHAATQDSGSNTGSLSTYEDSLTDLTPGPKHQLQSPEITREGPISLAQSRVWFLSENSERSSDCNLTFIYDVEGPLQVHRLQHALDLVMTHHDALRSCFFMRPGDNQLNQGVMSSPRHLFTQVRNGTADDVLRASDRLRSHAWDLPNGQMLGMAVVSKNSSQHTIVLGYHHIIMDAYSLGIFLRDLNLAYATGSLQQKPAAYLDFAKAEHSLTNIGYENEDQAEKIEFWKNEFATIPDPLPILPMSRVLTRPVAIRNKNVCLRKHIDKLEWAGILKASRALKVTPFHFHLATFQVLLARYANIEDFSVGIADANRLDDRYSETIGFFMNLLPMRCKVPKGAEFAQLARNTSRKALEVLLHSGISFDKIMEVTKAPRSPSYSPMFQASINYRMGAISDVPLGDCAMKLSDGQDAENPFDISLGILESKDGSATTEIICNADLFDPEAVSTLMDSYLRLLRGFTADPNLSTDCVEMHHPDAVQYALAMGRGPRVSLSTTIPAPIWAQFCVAAKSHAIEPAICHREKIVSYSALQVRARSIATSLVGAGCLAGSYVAVLCEPSTDFVASMLAIFHLGAIYCPLDISLPSARHEAMAQSCRPVAILYDRATSARALDLSSSLVADDDKLPGICVDDCNTYQATAQCKQDPDSPAILLFTSGSTGRPKGIKLTQNNIMNHISVKTRILQLQRERVLQQSSMSFDMSMIQILSALLNGGTVVIAPSEHRRDPVEITQLIRRQKVTMTIATPSEYKVWLNHDANLHVGLRDSAWRIGCLGGEAVSEQLLRDFALLGLPSLQLTNCYGPTEITAAATFKSINLDDHAGDQISERASSVGKALPNYSISIVDADGKPLPLGMRGEICVGGAGVALGYCDNVMQTTRQFIPDPSNSTGWPFPRMYRTGDQGRILPDGALQFVGRLDGSTQIKFHGVRMELEEIEGTMLANSDGKLSAVVVTLRQEALIAHATLTASVGAMNDEDIQVLRTSSARTLPGYMCPAALILVDMLPLTSAGKIDRGVVSALPIPKHTHQQHNDSDCGISASSRLTLREGELRLLWERVLSGPDRSIRSDSDFFNIGGNSLSLMRLQGAIKESIGVSVSTRDLYQSSSLRDMAKCISLEQEHHQLEEGNNTIIWDEETRIPPSVQNIMDRLGHQTGRRDRPRETNPINVLLTGSTSFLGGKILEALNRLVGSRIGKIYCIAVLPDDKMTIPASSSVVYYTGSLVQERLGLRSTEYAYLTSTVDLIIHAGANGHCLNNYQSLKIPNLDSTHQLVSMALPRSIPLLYVSSNRVTLLQEDTNALLPVSVRHDSPPTDGSQGYTATKWASEVFLERLSETAPGRSIPILISRPCVVVGDEAPNSDALNAILRYSRLMQTVPVFENVQGFLDFKKVETVAHEIAEDALSLLHAPGGVRIHHHSGGVRVPMEQLAMHMEALYAVKFEKCSLSEWIIKALRIGIDPLITAYLEAMVERGEVLRFPFMGESV